MAMTLSRVPFFKKSLAVQLLVIHLDYFNKRMLSFESFQPLEFVF